MWLKIDDRFPEHRKIRRLNDAAYRLHHEAMCAIARDETDGVISADDLHDLPHAPRLMRVVRELVAAGLWHPAGHTCDRCPQPPDRGFVIHDWLDYNESHAAQRKRRDLAKERQRRYRARARDPALPLTPM